MSDKQHVARLEYLRIDKEKRHADSLAYAITRLVELEAENERLRKAFRHHFAALPNDGDTCRVCGLNIRNGVHTRLDAARAAESST